MSSISKNLLKPIEAVSDDGNNRVRVNFLRFALPSKWFLALLAIPMLTALGISAYLTYVTVTASEIAGCSGGQLFDCAHVIYSKWSKMLGIPVSSMALGTYVAMVAATIVTATDRFSDSVRQMAWIAVTGLAIAASLAALYFIFLQVFVLKHLCPWCLGAHGCGLVIAIAILSVSRIPMPQTFSVSGLAAAGLAVMIGVQVNSEEPPKFVIKEYVPVVIPKENPGSQGETYVVAPAGIEMPPTDDDDMMLPPADDGFFAPPVEDDFEADMEPPSEDIDEVTEVETAAISLGSTAAYGQKFLSQLAVIQNPRLALMLLQEPVTQESGQMQKQQADDKKKAEMAAKAKQKKPTPRIVQFMGRKINAYQWPIDGKPDAKYVFVEMFDYTCPHCRTTSRALFDAKARLGDDLAIVALPVPMNTRCNSAVTQDHEVHLQACELSTLAVAVWRSDSSQFSTFHRWMFEGKDAPNYQTALAKAGELVGKERIEKELKGKTAAAYVQSHVQMYKLVNAGAVPKLLFPSRAIEGEFTALESLLEQIKLYAAQ